MMCMKAKHFAPMDKRDPIAGWESSLLLNCCTVAREGCSKEEAFATWQRRTDLALLGPCLGDARHVRLERCGAPNHFCSHPRPIESYVLALDDNTYSVCHLFVVSRDVGQCSVSTASYTITLYWFRAPPCCALDTTPPLRIPT